MRNVIDQELIAAFVLENSGAAWLWPARLGAGMNQYVDFRQDFSLDQIDAGAEVLISADSNYALWINDSFVDCGQYHDFANRKTYDRLAIGSCLRAGSNALLVRVHYQGAESFQYQKGAPGVIFAIKNDSMVVVSGSESRYRTSPGYRQGPYPKVTGQLGFAFEFDARDEGTQWSNLRNDDITEVDLNTRSLSPRPVEKLLLKPRPVSTICAQGVFHRELHVDQADLSVAKIMQSDLLSPRFPREFFHAPVIRSLPSSEGIVLNEKYLNDDGVYLVVDLGREEAGLLEIEIDADAGTVVDIAYGEHLDDLRVRAAVGSRNFANRYICKEGRQIFLHALSRLAGRYVQLNVSGATTHFRLYFAGLRPVEYPLQFQGEFRCSDSLKERIYQTSIRTLHLCMHEHYEDCPWREQALYAFDARNQALCGYYGFGEYRFPEASFGLLERGLRDDGYLEMCAPASIDITIPMFSFSWVLAVDDYWLYTAEPSFVKRMLPSIQRMLRIHAARMKDDLLPCMHGQRYWHFYEWAPGLDGSERIHSEDVVRFDSPLNLMFCLALNAGARLSDSVGDHASAEEFREISSRLARRIDTVFWDQNEGAYLTYSGHQAQRHVSEFVQSLALLAKAPATLAAEKLRHRLSQPDNGLVATTLSHCHYKFEALLMEQEKYGHQVFETISCDWGGMLMRGATSFWETISGGDDFDQAGSLCHGWSAIPVYFYMAYLLGVRPLEPGYRRFTIDPVPGIIASAAGSIPTPHGDIQVKWDNRGDRFECYDVNVPNQIELVLGLGSRVQVP